jgi:Fe2+ transport system protein FeoA
MVTCALCGFTYEPGGEACRSQGCPLAFSNCAIAHCPRCGYAAPDEARGLAGWLRRLMAPERGDADAPMRLVDAAPGWALVIDRVDAPPATAARLTVLGMTPGTAVSLQQRFPTFVVDVDGADIALEASVAQTIWVKVPARPDQRPRAASRS